jgi:hypothetical protein
LCIGYLDLPVNPPSTIRGLARSAPEPPAREIDPSGDLGEHVDRIAAIQDPVARARAAGELLAEHQSAVARLAQIRRKAIAELRDQGFSYAQLGESLGLTRGRIAQLRGPDATLEAAFFGGRQITIAMPLRKQKGGRSVVAQEDADATTVLAEYLTGLDLDTSMQRIPAGGGPDLEPDALIVICGPGTSAKVAELLETDPVFDYRQRRSGAWTIRDRESRREYRSPLSDAPGADRDIAYFGRLSRPDGRPLILIAGVHAIGSLGVAHYLVAGQHLHEIHDAAPSANAFSMLIGCAFEPTTLTIRSAEALTPPRLHAQHA